MDTSQEHRKENAGYLTEGNHYASDLLNVTILLKPAKLSKKAFSPIG